MEDLSRINGDPINAMIPTSQHGGNQVWANNAMTAPGGPSGDLGNDLNQAVVVDAPEIDAQVYESPVLIGPDGAKVHADNADRDDPYNRADGSGWFSGTKIAPPSGTVPPPGFTGKWVNC